MDRLLAWTVKLLVLLAVAPLLLCLVLQSVVGLLSAILPWLVLFSLVSGVAAGITAAARLGRRLPPHRAGDSGISGGLPFETHRVRRPRGGGNRR
jgi:hypothetical protein